MSATLSCLLHKFPLYLRCRYERGQLIKFERFIRKIVYEAWNYPKYSILIS